MISRLTTLSLPYFSKLLLAVATWLLLPNLALAGFLGLAEYEAIKSPVYLASLTLAQKPNNSKHIHSMQGKKQFRLHIQKAGYPLRSFYRHLESWAIKGNINNTKASESSKNSIATLEKRMKEAINRPFIKRGDIILFDIFNDNIRIYINGKILLDKKDKNLIKYLINIWVGSPPADESFFKSLVKTSSKSKEYQALVNKLILANPNFNKQYLSFTGNVQTATDIIEKKSVKIPGPVKKAAKPIETKITKKAYVKVNPKIVVKPAIEVVAIKPAKNKIEPAPQPTTMAKPTTISHPSPAIGTSYTNNTASHVAVVISNAGYPEYIKNLLIKALKASSLPIEIEKMPEATLFISNQGMVYSGEFAITPKAGIKITRKERMVLKKSAISISPVPVTQAMKDNKGLYIVKVALSP